MNMVWHIFKKDWQLMWKAVVAVACIQAAFTVIQLLLSINGGNAVLQQLGHVLLWLWLMSGGILTVTIVHQDPLPSTRHDWLTRPIPRTYLLIEKVLFALVTVQGASILSDLAQGLILGFPLRATIDATVARAVIFFIGIILPSLALGAITQSVTEAVVVLVVTAFGVFAFTMVAIGLGGGYGHQFDPTGLTGEEWLMNALRFALFLFGVAGILIWQYRTRNTWGARVLMAMLLAVALCSQFTPWKPVFAFQETLSPEPGAAGKIVIASQAQSIPDRTRLATEESRRPVGGRLVLTLAVSGMAANTVLKADKSEITITGSAGKRLYKGTGGDVEIRNDHKTDGQVSYDQEIDLPPQSIMSQPAQASVVYYMTLFKLGASYSLRAVDDSQLLPGWGWCRSSINADDTAIEVNCIQMGKGPMCATVFLEHVPSGQRNPVNTACYPNYAPYSDRPIPDALSRFRLVLPFRDRTGITKYPVDSSRLTASKIMIRMYVPQDHFTREVTSPLTWARGWKGN